MAVPSNESSPTNTGIDAINEMAFVLKAKEDSKIGASGCTVVKPSKAKTTMYSAPVHEMKAVRQPYRSKNHPTAGVSTMGMMPCRLAL